MVSYSLYHIERNLIIITAYDIVIVIPVIKRIKK